MSILERINRLVWGAPALICILGVGLYFTFSTGFAQLRLLPLALRRFFSALKKRDQPKDGAVTPFRAMCTALAATVGTGNLVGVAGAICIGGPGAVFWMWISAILGMILKFAEAALAVRFCSCSATGERIGGPMYMIRRGLPQSWHWLAGVYCFFGVIAAFGVGNATQINSLVTGVNGALEAFGRHASREGNLLLGIALGILITVLLFGGAKRIGAAAELLVPFAALMYLLLGIGVLATHVSNIPGALRSIVTGAFSPRAATGGLIGSCFQALRVGISRGVFTNEAGMGTAGIAHAGAQVRHPAEQGLLGIVEVFLDTIVICTMTALVILCSGVPIPYGHDVGGSLTTSAFMQTYGGFAAVFMAGAMSCFALATVLGWGLYGLRCAQFLLGEGAWRWFAALQGAAVVLGAVLETGTVWIIAEIVNGLMAIPNLIALLALSPELHRILNTFTREKVGS